MISEKCVRICDYSKPRLTSRRIHRDIMQMMQYFSFLICLLFFILIQLNEI